MSWRKCKPWEPSKKVVAEADHQLTADVYLVPAFVSFIWTSKWEERRPGGVIHHAMSQQVIARPYAG